MSPAPDLDDRLPALDGVRGLAALMVVPHNLLLIQTPTDLASGLFVASFDRGWIGVQLFFVLSGFLITGILLDGRGEGLGHFFARRVLRIFPLYYATLLLVLVVLPAFGALPSTVHRNPPQEIWYWTYLSNWSGPFHQGTGSFPHFWSLAVEEQFYLLWPFLIGRRSARSVFVLCLAAAAVGPLSRALVLAWPWPEQAAYEFTVCRIDALALGGAAAAALRDEAWGPRLRQHHRALLAAAVFVLGVGAVLTHGYRIFGAVPQVAGYLALAIAFALGVLGIACSDLCADRGVTQALRWPALRRVGQYSYGLYVVHVPLHAIVGLPLLAWLGYAKPYPLPVAMAYVALGTLVSYLAAVLLYHGIERRFLKLKAHFPRALGAPAAGRTPLA